jgi:hypothetical protein
LRIAENDLGWRGLARGPTEGVEQFDFMQDTWLHNATKTEVSGLPIYERFSVLLYSEVGSSSFGEAVVGAGQACSYSYSF